MLGIGSTRFIRLGGQGFGAFGFRMNTCISKPQNDQPKREYCGPRSAS